MKIRSARRAAAPLLAPFRRPAGVAVALALATTPIAAQTYTWNSTAGGSWADTSRWTPVGVPNGTDVVADVSTQNITANQTITLDGSFTVGTLRIGDATTASHDWTIAPGTGGTLTLATSAGVPTVNVVNRTTTITAVLAGTQGFTKSGVGVLALSGANTISGSVAVTAGELALATPTALGTVSAVTVSSGADLALVGAGTYGAGTTLTLAGNGGIDPTYGSLRLANGATAGVTATWAGAINLASDVRIGVSGTADGTLILSGVIGSTGVGPYGIAVRSGTTASVVQLNAVNTYTGATQAVVGTLRAGVANALPDTLLAVGNTANAGTAVVDLNGFDQRVSGLSQNGGSTMAASVTNLSGTAATLTVDGVASSTYGTYGSTTAGVITGNLGLTKTGAGTLALRAANTYTGPTAVRAGGLQLDFSGAGGVVTNVLYNGATPAAALTLGGGGLPAVLTLTGSTTAQNSQAFTDLTASGVATVNVNPGSATQGSTTLAFTGSNLTVNPGGFVQFVTTGAFGTDPSVAGAAVLPAAFGTANTILAGANGVLLGTIGGDDWAAKNAANTHIVTGTAAGIYTDNATTPGTLTGNANVTTADTLGADANPTSVRFATGVAYNLGGKTLTTGGVLVASTTAAATTISNGFLQGPTAGADVVIAQNRGTNNMTVSAVIRSNGTGGGLVKAGAGTVVLSGTTSNTFTGTTTVLAGQLTLSKSGGATALGGDVVVTGGNLTPTASNQIADTATLTFNGSTAVYNPSNPVSETVAAVNLYATAGSNSGFSTGASGQLTVTGTLTVTGGQFVVNSSPAATPARLTVGGLVMTGGAALFGTTAAAGNGTSYLVVGAGGLTIGNGATLNVAAAAASGAANGGIILNGDLTSLAAATANTISRTANQPGGGTLDLNGAARTFTVQDGSAGSDLILSVILSGTGSSAVVKAGPGTLSLAPATTATGVAGANLYAGGTTVQAGTLLLSGTGGLPAGGAVTLSGGTLATVTGVSSLSLGGLTVTAPSTISLVPTGANYNLSFTAPAASGLGTVLTITGSSTADGAAGTTGGHILFTALDTTSNGGNVNQTYQSFLSDVQFTGYPVGAAVLIGTGAGPYELVASSTAVPEPATVGLLAAAGLGACGSVRRRRRA